MNRNSEKTRRRILLAAAEIFAEKGFRTATVRQICAKAEANIAAINYHFDSKENLYYETFKFIFLEAAGLVSAKKPVAVRSEADWHRALHDWARALLDQVTSPQKTRGWETKLYARERLDPSRVLPVLLDEFLLPISDRLEQLLLMGLPKDVSPLLLKSWVVSVIGHCTMYGQREKPWDGMLFTAGVSREEWLESTAQFVVDGITARLKFRTGDIPAVARTADYPFKRTSPKD